jgi:ABC-2 type transport system ATP-binding protein
MLHRPQLLLLDEPTAGVDPKARRDFWEELHGLAARGLSVLVSTHYMDEAERCHRLAYLAYGKLLVTGTAREVVEQRGLSVFTISGPDPAALASRLRATPGVLQVTPFGTTLHVAGTDAAQLESGLAFLRADPQYRVEQSAATLEDVFISLMPDSSDDLR